jgi:hypothetical protein
MREKFLVGEEIAGDGSPVVSQPLWNGHVNFDKLVSFHFKLMKFIKDLALHRVKSIRTHITQKNSIKH